jgi:hypothetical protein
VKCGPLVVHLGDSMTFGTGVDADEAFPALLDRRHPQTAHASYSVWAVGTDFEYLLLGKILAVHTPALVVLHVFLGNDVYEMDRPYECCDMGPLLDYPRSGPTARCSEPRWGFSVRAYLGRSPSPYPLRVATAWSASARYAAAAFSQFAFRFDRPPHLINAVGEASEDGWEHFTQVLAAMRDELATRGIPFVVSLLPTRFALENAAHGGAWMRPGVALPRSPNGSGSEPSMRGTCWPTPSARRVHVATFGRSATSTSHPKATGWWPIGWTRSCSPTRRGPEARSPEA